MARQDRDLRTDDVTTETPIYTTDRDRAVRDYRESRRGAAPETRSMLQDLAWFIPLLLLGLLGYYLYQSWYATPAARPAATTPAATAPATTDAARTTPAETPAGTADTATPTA